MRQAARATTGWWMMDLVEPGAALASGLLAGLAVAVPLGAVGVLLIQEGVSFGFRRAWPAAAGVATVDMSYCLAAVLLGGAAAPWIARLQPWPAVIGGVALLMLAVMGLLRVRRMDGTQVGNARSPGQVWGSERFWLFVGLTLVNPATVVYFAALIAGLPALSESWSSATLFVIGVAVASLGWQLLLVFAGSLLRARARPSLQRVTMIVGSTLVGAFGVIILLAGT